MPLALASTAVPAFAGDFVADPIHDFDCDDQRDGVQPTPYKVINGHSSAGSITVQYSADDEIVELTQDTAGISGAPEHDDHFGQEFASYDENGDGCDDLVVSAPWEGLTAENGDSAHGSGMIWIIPGSPEGLRPDQSRSMNLATPGITGTAEEDDEFGEDGLSVLNYQAAPGKPVSALVAVGSPSEDIGEDDYWQGMAHLIRTSKDTDRQQLASVHQDTPGVEGRTEPADFFGGHIVLSTDAETGIGGPANTHWAVSAEERGSPTVPGDGNDWPQVHVFDVSATPGDTGKLIKADDFGIPLSKERDLESWSASGDYLYIETPGDKPGSDEKAYPDTVYGVPWPNILDGQDLPVVQHRVTPWP